VEVELGKLAAEKGAISRSGSSGSGWSTTTARRNDQLMKIAQTEKIDLPLAAWAEHVEKITGSNVVKFPAAGNRSA
jgi:hypothetical protein